MINSKKIIPFAAAALCATALASAPLTHAFADDAALVSRGVISYDNDGDGDCETLLDSQDLRNLNAGIDCADTNRQKAQDDLDVVKDEVADIKSDYEKAKTTLAANKAQLVDTIKQRFNGVGDVSNLKEDSSFNDINTTLNNLGNATKVWTGTLAQYNAIPSKDNNTIYLIKD